VRKKEDKKEKDEKNERPEDVSPARKKKEGEFILAWSMLKKRRTNDCPFNLKERKKKSRTKKRSSFSRRGGGGGGGGGWGGGGGGGGWGGGGKERTREKEDTNRDPAPQKMEKGGKKRVRTDRAPQKKSANPAAAEEGEGKRRRGRRTNINRKGSVSYGLRNLSPKKGGGGHCQTL